MGNRRIRYLVIHRIKLNQDDFAPNGAGVTRFFENGPGSPYTGGKMPYHFVIDESGQIASCVHIRHKTPHARKYNSASIAVAVYGDFRTHAPTHGQVLSLVQLLAELKDFYPQARIVGHTDLPEASADPNKVCPGHFLPTKVISNIVEDICRMTNGGAVISE